MIYCYQVSILDEKDVKMVPLVSEIKLVAERNDDLTFQLLRFVEYLYYVKHYKIKLISKLPSNGQVCAVYIYVAVFKGTWHFYH